MKQEFEGDLRIRFIELEKRSNEYYVMNENLEEKIKMVEDDTNKKLDDYCEKTNLAEENRIKAYKDYLDKALIYGTELLSKIQNMRVYFEQNLPGVLKSFGDKSLEIQYYKEPSNNIHCLEKLYDDISLIVNECVGRNNQGFFGFGKRLLGYDNDRYSEISRLFETASAFGNGLSEWFDKLYSQFMKEIDRNRKEYFDNACAQADRLVEEYEKEFYQSADEWLRGFREELEYLFPHRYLEQMEERVIKIRDDEKAGGGLNADIAHEELLMGEQSLYLGVFQSWDDLYGLVKERFGKYIEGDYIYMPAIWSKENNLSIIFNSNQESNEWCQKDIESILLKYIKASPAGEQLITICSADGIVYNSRFMTQFVSMYEDITGGKILTSSEDIQKTIEKYIEIMDDVTQRKLVGCRNIQEYNEKNPYHKIPGRCLCIMGFPTGFNEKTARDVLRLLKQGYRAGIQVILQTVTENYDDTCYGAYAKLLEEIQELDANYQAMNGYWRNRKYPDLDLKIKQEDFISDTYNLFEEFERSYQNITSKVLDAEGLTGEKNWFKGYSGDMLRIPIGVNEMGKIQYLEMGDPIANGTSHYAIITGPTGSGKSTLLHTIIMQALLTYSPDELELYLMDFKEGTEFKIYEERRIPQIKCIALDAMQEFGESILNYLWEVLKERTELFLQASRNGSEIKNIAQYRKAGYKMPRILVIIDEFQVLFDREQNKKVADRCAAKMSDFISRARVYGIHFIFATQTLHKVFEGTSSISRATLEEMHIRVGLQCQPKEMELLFGSSNLKNCMLKSQSQKGAAVYLENDIVSTPVGIKVAYIEPEKQKSYLRKVEKEFMSEKKTSCLIFRGSNEPIFDRTEIDNIIYLGEPISIAKPVGIDVGKRRRNNLLIIGENQKMLERIINLWIKEILLMKRKDEVKSLYIFDGAEMIDEASSIEPIVQNEKTVEHVTNVFCVIPVIERLYAIYSERKKNMAEGIKCEKDRQKLFVVFSNYQWIEPLSRMMENKSVTEFMPGEEKQGSTLDDLMTSFKPMSQTMTPNNKLRVLLESGYLCGIHITMSCNDYSYIKKILSTELSPFTNRIALKTVSNVMYSFINTDINTKYMRDNTALFSDGVTEPYLFKPYRMEV